MRREVPHEAAYAIPAREGKRTGLKCVNCGKTAEPWAVPLDPRVAVLCDKCQREHPWLPIPKTEKKEAV